MYGASIAFGGDCRSAMRSGSSSDAGNPSGHASSTIRSPLQNDPKLSHGVPLASSTIPGSMALKSAPSDEITAPRSTHSYPTASGSSVVFVARAITDRLLPNVDAE